MRTCPVQRGHSDSSVPSCRSASGTGHTWSASEDILTKSPPPCTCGNHNASTSKQTSSVPLLQRVKARRKLQLPSFRSLGIAAGGGNGPSGALATGALPTPPEEAISSETSLTVLLPGQLSRSISFTEGILPTTPGFHEYSNSHPTKGLDEAAGGMSEHSTSATPDANPTATTSSVQDSTTADQETPRADTVVREASETGGDDSDSDDSGFVIGAISFTGESKGYDPLLRIEKPTLPQARLLQISMHRFCTQCVTLSHVRSLLPRLLSILSWPTWRLGQSRWENMSKSLIRCHRGSI